jgi:hypothetical protein
MMLLGEWGLIERSLEVCGEAIFFNLAIASLL